MANVKDADILKHLRKIISKNNLSTITPREIRSSLEKSLGVEQGSLDSERDRIKGLAQSVFTEVVKEEEEKDEEDDKPFQPPQPAKQEPAKVQKRKKDEDDEEPAPKKNAKTNTKNTATKKTSDEFSVQIESGPNPVYCKISVFKGKTMVDLRKYYTDKSGEEKPTQKGISLMKDQWEAFKAVLPEIDEALKGFP